MSLQHGDCRSYCSACELEEAEARERNGRTWAQFFEDIRFFEDASKPEPAESKEPPGERYWPAHSSI